MLLRQSTTGIVASRNASASGPDARAIDDHAMPLLDQPVGQFERIKLAVTAIS